MNILYSQCSVVCSLICSTMYMSLSYLGVEANMNTVSMYGCTQYNFKVTLCKENSGPSGPVLLRGNASLQVSVGATMRYTRP